MQFARKESEEEAPDDAEFGGPSDKEAKHCFDYDLEEVDDEDKSGGGNNDENQDNEEDDKERRTEDEE